MVTDAYPPMRTSCAVQMYDLGQAFIEEGHQVTLITPVSALKEKISISLEDSVRLVQVKTFKTKDVNYVYRTFAEFVNPFLIWYKLKKAPEFLGTQYDGIIWYSPTIFWGPLIKRLKQLFEVKAYLILRDIFPDWIFHLGIIKKGLIFSFFKTIEKFQYLQADTIGVQSPNNLKYFKEKNQGLRADVEVLWNWIGRVKESPYSLDLSKTHMAGRSIFIYAGNIGVAQGSVRLLATAIALEKNHKVGFLVLGRGVEIDQLRLDIKINNLTNVLILDEIRPDELNYVFGQCSAGIVTLDHRHQSHNIPGKFLSYIRSNLPVLAILNQDNDLFEMISENNLGIAVDGSLITDFSKSVISLSKFIEDKLFDAERASNLMQTFFSPKSKVAQIIQALH